MFMAHAVQSVRASGQWMSGGNIAQNARNLLFNGFNLQANFSDFGTLDYVVLDTDGFSWELQPTYHIEMQTDMVRFLGTADSFPPSWTTKNWFQLLVYTWDHLPWRWVFMCMIFWFFFHIDIHAFYVSYVSITLCVTGVNLLHMVLIFLSGFLFIFFSIGCSYCIRYSFS